MFSLKTHTVPAQASGSSLAQAWQQLICPIPSLYRWGDVPEVTEYVQIQSTPVTHTLYTLYI